jgi:hypothetical protein
MQEGGNRDTVLMFVLRLIYFVGLHFVGATASAVADRSNCTFSSPGLVSGRFGLEFVGVSREPKLE